MNIKVAIFTLTFLTTTAYPLYRDALWTDTGANQAHAKTEISKDTDATWKSHVENGNLYIQEGADTNPLVGEIHRKLSLESEKLRARLRQELAELRQKLSPLSSYPAQPHSSSMAGIRERLAPVTQQLQNVVALVGGSTQEMCGQLKLYLQSLEAAESQAGAGPAHYREAVQWISQRLDDNGAKTDGIIQEFQTETSGVIRELRASGAKDEAGFWEDLSARVGQEVKALRQEAQGKVAALKAELAALLVSAQSLKVEGLVSLERYCHDAAEQNRLFQARIEKQVLGLEEEKQTSSSSIDMGFHHEDFSSKLSALLQDIKDSLPTQIHT